MTVNKRLAQAGEAVESEVGFLDAFDRREINRIESALRAATGAEDARSEKRRVRALLERDRADRNREAYRSVAEQQVANGEFANIADTVMEPTPEWLAQGETRTYVPKQPDGTVRTIRTVRRVELPVLIRLCGKGKIDFEQLMACKRYRDAYERGGLAGRARIARYGLQGQLPTGSGGKPSPIPVLDHELDAREEFRAARRAIQARFRPFFESIVLEESSPRAVRRGVCQNGRETALFAALAQRLVNHYHQAGLQLVERH